MKNTTKTCLEKVSFIKAGNVTYSLQETCPICGIYMPNGEICLNCLNTYKLGEDNNAQ